MFLVTAAQMQSLDRRTIEEAKVPGTTLMENAGRGVVEAFEKAFGSPAGKRVTIFCGKGNNGGDGFVVARLLRRKRAKVRVLLFADPKELRGDAQTMHRRLVRSAGASVVTPQPAKGHIRDQADHADVLIDALLGTGLSSPVKGRYQEAITEMNASSAPTIAVDLPSGIHSDNGQILGTAVDASLTVTFGCPKVGLYLGAAIDQAGRILVSDIGIPQEYVRALGLKVQLLTPQMIKPLLPQRSMTSHKGTYGHAGIIAGSPGKTGAAALAGKSALRIGTGLVTVATPKTVNPTLEAKLLEAMTAPMPETDDLTLGLSAYAALSDFAKTRSAIAIGPGIGTHHETGELVRTIIQNLNQPCVVDADALNLLAGHTSILLSSNIPLILTPHPGEMSRLLGNHSPKSVNDDRLGVARRFAQTHHVVVVLKGARTIVASPDGQAAICPTGNPGMASAGMGDALTGMIVGLLAQGLSPWNAAKAGVYLHGLAGDIAAEKLGQAGLIASDLIECIPHALTQTLSPSRS
jgi:NAD(P)H-hydrate epimerase